MHGTIGFDSATLEQEEITTETGKVSVLQGAAEVFKSRPAGKTNKYILSPHKGLLVDCCVLRRNSIEA